MRISLEELQKVARARRAQQTGTAPMEPVPAPFVACEEADWQLARELSRQLAQMPDLRTDRVQDVGVQFAPAQEIATAIMRRVIADKLSKE